MSNLKQLPGVWIRIGNRADRIAVGNGETTDREVLCAAGEVLSQRYALQLRYGVVPITVERVSRAGERKVWRVNRD